MWGIPWWLRRSSVCLQCGRPGFDPLVGKIPWRRKWQPTPVLLPIKFHGWRSLLATVHGVAKSRTGLSKFTFLLNNSMTLDERLKFLVSVFPFKNKRMSWTIFWLFYFRILRCDRQGSQGWYAKGHAHPLTPLPCFRMVPRDACFIPKTTNWHTVTEKPEPTGKSDFFQKFIDQ